MGKPDLLVLQSERHFAIPTYAEGPEVRKRFEVHKAQFVEGVPDLVYTQAYGGFYSQLRALDVPYVVHLGGNPWLELRGGRLVRATAMLEKAALVTCVSRFLAGEVVRGLGRDMGNVVALPGGLWGQDHTPLGPSLARFPRKQDHAISGERPLVVMSIPLINDQVRINKWQGLPVWLEAVEGVLRKHRARIVCAGRGAMDFPYLQEWRNRWNFEFYRQHQLDDREDRWPALLGAADVFVHPGMYDCWPRVVAEAMLVGLPCFAYDVTGNGEVGDAVITAKPREAGKTAEVLDMLLTDERMRETVGRHCREEAIRKTKAHRGDLAHLLIKALEARR